MPVGCYYPSKYTQSLLYEYGDLYLPYKNHPALCELSIGDDRESFEDDTKIKRDWFPQEYGYTDNEEISRLTKHISKIQPSIRSGKMRTRLTANISRDITGGSSVYEVLCQVLGSREFVAEIVKPLKKMIEVQEFALLPPYIQIELDRHGISAKQGQRRWLEFILFKAYSQSCKEAYQSYCNNPLSIFYDSAFTSIYPYHLDYRDTNLFQQFIILFPFNNLENIEKFNSSDVLSIKYSHEFGNYLYTYKRLVNILKEELQTVLIGNWPEYEEVKRPFQYREEREFDSCKHLLIDNTHEAITLYKILRNPFMRTKRFQGWLSHRFELPTMQMRACLKDEKTGILQEYIREIFQQTKQTYQQRRQDYMKNISINIGHDNKSEQTNSIQYADRVSANGEKLITQDDFKAIPVDAIEKFRKEICENPDIDRESKKAILAILNAKYSFSPEEYAEYLAEWKENKKMFSQKVRDAISVAADLAGIAAFFKMLLGI